MPDPASYQGTPYQGIIPLVTGINDFIHSSIQNASKNKPLVDADFNTVLPKIGVSYHWSEDLTTSFTFQQGYRSGGVGTNDSNGKSFQYDPEYTDNYELSLRSSWLDGALIANANVFYVDWTDQQVIAQLSTNTFDTETGNAAKSTLKGFELEMNYQLSHQLKLYSALGLAKSEFTDYILPIPGADDIDLSGRSFADSPKWTATLGGTYVADNGFFADINANYASESPAEVNPYAQGISENDPDFDQNNDNRTLVNMQLGYEWKNIGVYLIARNILDEEYIAQRSTRYITLGKPRQIGLSVRGSF